MSTAFRLWLVAVGLLISMAATAAKPTIIWAVPDWPPFYIHDGPNAGQGISDRNLRFFQKRLEGIQHEQAPMNFARYMQEAREGNNVCMVDLFKTPERRAILHYSRASIIGLPLSVIIPRAQLQAWGNPTSLSLKQLLTDTKREVRFVAKRSYSTLETIIRDNVHRDHVDRSSVDAPQLLGMLFHGRVDYFVDYPFVAQYMSRTHFPDQAIVSIPIEEQPDYVLAYATCAKTPLGREVINRIDRIIETEKATPAYDRLLTDREFFMDDRARERLQHLYETVFLKLE